MSRRKGTPCACECDPCGSKKCIKAINNVSGDPNGDFEIKAGNGIGISQSGDNSITIINQSMASSFVAGDNIEINPSGDDLEIRLTDNPVINGTLQVNGDIIQQGAAYETHAEKVYTTNDYIYMRDGALAGLGSGDYAGFQVKLYDGVNDGRLVIDNSGVARVGDVGDEQPLLTRSESAQLNNGDLLQWNGTSQKAVSSGINTNDVFFKSGDSYTTGSSHIINGYIYDEDSLWMQAILPKKADNLTIASVSVTSLQLATLTGKKILTADVTNVTGTLMSSQLLRLNVSGNFNFATSLYDTPISGFFTYTITFN